jgi:hypothetical protein
MQRCHFYIFHHATKVINAVVAYWARHGIVNINMV